MGQQTASGGTTVTQLNPPSYQLPYLEEGLGTARGLFQEGGPQQYQGNTVTPFAPQTEQALQGITDRATNGSPLTSAAQQQVTDTVSGKYLDPSSNPYLDSTFKKAADQSYNTLSTQFANSGRNVDAAAPVQADLLSGLATKIYGGNYQAERDRQTQQLGYASPLAEADYRDLAALQGVGQTVEDKTGQIIADQQGRWNYDQQRPQNNLNDYLSRIMRGTGSTQTEQAPDIYRNQTAGALGGALQGYQAGQGYGQYGGAIGALLGGLLNAYGG
ncbi:MAG: hypothetical protein WDO56_35145 [Gammaproteobacteria bacterium]